MRIPARQGRDALRARSPSSTVESPSHAEHGVAPVTRAVGLNRIAAALAGHDFGRLLIRPPSPTIGTPGDSVRSAYVEALGQTALAITTNTGSGERLPAHVRSTMETRFGFDLDRVRVHYSSEAPGRVGAKALTRGDHVWFAAGRDATDQSLLGHEIAHVVQQATGKATPLAGQTGSVRDQLEQDAWLLSDVGTRPAGGRIGSMPAHAGPAVVQFDFEEDVLALLRRMPSAEAENLTPADRRRRIAALADRREKLRQLFSALRPDEAIRVRERLRTRIAGDRLSERFHDILATATRNDLVDMLEGFFSIGPAVGRILSGADFCRPFTQDELNAGLDLAIGTDMERFVNEDIRSVFGDEAADLWEEYLTRTPQDSLVPHVFNDPSSQIVKAFVRHSDTARRQQRIIDAVEANLPGRCPPLAQGVWTDVDVAALLPASELNAPFSFGAPATTIPGLIAGGVSASAAGMDTRNVSGQVQLMRVRGPGGSSTVRLRTRLRFMVRDAVDFCPGGMGGRVARFVTVPLSRLEASGLAFDVPFEIHYDGPAMEVDLGGVAARACP